MKTQAPRGKEAARVFYQNIITLGKIAYDNYVEEVRRGEHLMDFAELNELKDNIAICQAELDKLQ
jgi:hypothetical protein